MVTYIIASKANQPYLAECQALGEFLEQNCPDVNVKTVIKAKEEWSPFLDSVCRSYGFYTRSCPLVYTIEGLLIGDGASFVEHVRERYQKVQQMTNEQQKKRTAENVEMIAEQMRKKKDGMTLGEKIEHKVEDVKGKKAAVNLIGDEFYSKVSEGGLTWYLRRADLNAYHGRFKDVEDEELKRNLEEVKRQEYEDSRDMRYDEFLANFEDHIEGNAKNDRVARESNFGDDAKSTRSKSAKGTRKDKSEPRVPTGASKAQEEANEANSREKLASRHSAKSDNSHMKEINQKFEEERMTLPSTCYVDISKSTKIEKMEGKYLLISHPQPQVEGQMLLIQHKKEDQPEDEHCKHIVYRDYSLRKRIPTRPKPQLTATEQLRMKKDKSMMNMSKLQCLEVDLMEPLCQTEWANIAEIINQTKGLGWFQILPAMMKSSNPFQFNSIHLLPGSKIPVEKLPIDLHIHNIVSYNRKLDRKNLLGGGQKQQDETIEEVDEYRLQMEQFARSQGFLMIPEYQFDHCIYQLTENTLTADGIVYAFQKAGSFLQLRQRQEIGMTVIVTPKWLMVCALTNPYTTSQEGIPSFLDGLAFTGIVNLQSTKKQWPATAGIDDNQIGIVDAFKVSTKTEKLPGAFAL